ncbi:cardiotrophin-1-like [Hemiscyllium ocellatum]|uniref:cardiotrophin-1-like n=1 Tax=Hemiscyllium ocellatum TaxID=170820 RepID=UPI0029672B7D|nr:cardiotrophin-1-like [Hemiscyllium ocellatum]
MSNADSLSGMVERCYQLLVWLGDEAPSLLQLYMELQGFRDGPPGMPGPHLRLPAPPGPDGDDWEPARRLCQHRSASRQLASLLGGVLGEQRVLNETRHQLHQQLQLAITGLQGLDANLGHALASLGTGQEQEDGQEAEESDGPAQGPSDQASGLAHWEAKVNGYHIVAHYTQWVGRAAEDLVRLKELLKPEA